MNKITTVFLSMLLTSISVQANGSSAPADGSESSADTFSIAAKEWQAYIKPLEPIGERVVKMMSNPEDPQLRQEIYKHLYSLMAQGYFGLVYADAKHPDFWPMLNPVFNTLGPNPDDSYYMAPIDDNGVYKISGYRGSVRILDFAVGSGSMFTRGDGQFGPTLANYNADTLELQKDGYFEVILSEKRPKDHQGNWWKLDPKGSYLMVRQISYDWINEVDGRFAIERLDTPAPKPRQSADEIAARLQQIAGWAERNMKWTMEFVNRYREQGLINKLWVHGYDKEGGHTSQKYADGLFDLQADEALLIETTVPQCVYWSFQLSDELYATLDYINRQTNLNGHTAKLDSDGKLRLVISEQDPGVPNWLDTAGYQQGEILGRWFDCDGLPEPKVTLVKIDELRKSLPKDTPVVTEAQRDETLRLRRRAAQLRRRW